MLRHPNTALVALPLALTVSLLVAACRNTAVTTPTPPPPTAAPTPAPTAAPPTAPASTPGPVATPRGTTSGGSTPAPAAHLAGIADLRTVMPSMVGGKQLSKTQFEGADFASSPGAVSQQMVDLLKALGRTPADLTMAIASVTPGAIDPSITAFRVHGVQADVFLSSYVPLITSAVPGTQVSQAMLSGKAVWLVSGGATSPPSYLVPRDDVLFVVVAGTQSVALEAIGDLP